MFPFTPLELSLKPQVFHPLLQEHFSNSKPILCNCTRNRCIDRKASFHHRIDRKEYKIFNDENKFPTLLFLSRCRTFAATDTDIVSIYLSVSSYSSYIPRKIKYVPTDSFLNGKTVMFY